MFPLPGSCNRPVILPISGKKLRFITAGMRCMGGEFDANTSSGALGGEVVHVEVAPGNVIVVAAWMLDAAACAGMELGDAAGDDRGAGSNCISCLSSTVSDEAPRTVRTIIQEKQR